MKKKVVLVDDDPRLRRLVAATLGSEYALLEAANGEEALEIARREHPDLLLLDVRMPGLNGFEVCRRLKDDQATASAKVIVLSALGSDEDRRQGFKAGADDYFPKPFSPKALLERIGQMLE